jgi:outer membrane protein TolC
LGLTPPAAWLVIAGLLIAVTALAWAEVGDGEAVTLAAPVGAADGAISMTLPEAVLLAVRNNIGLRNAYLGQVVDKYRLWVSEGKFVPQGQIRAGFSESRQRAPQADANARESLRLAPELSWKAPTGADFRFVWDAQGSRGNNIADSSGSVLGVQVTQPLLRGAGVELNRISVDLARSQYESSLQGLRDTLARTITSVIRTYRDLMLARGRLEIDRRALERARQLVVTNRELIAAGRMAKQDLIQAESDVASRELALASSENSLDQTRLSLIGLLNLTSDARIQPTEPIEVVDIDMDAARFLAIALEQRPDYIRARLAVADRALNQRLAENNSEWTLNLSASSGISSRSDHWFDPGPNQPLGEDWSVGLDLIVPLFDRSQREQRVSAEVSLRQAENSLVELRQRIEREIQNAVRDIQIQRRQVDLSQQSRELKEQQLAVEREKLNLGRSTNFQVVQYQNDLVNAQNAELSAIASYLNALTALDETLGTTLETWQIDIADLPIPAGPRD